ncbi:hypothetical protein CSB69_3358 [Morganella morganii]|nr:hypothetical protein CSB69_3358 [Morganella morganii]
MYFPSDHRDPARVKKLTFEQYISRYYVNSARNFRVPALLFKSRIYNDPFVPLILYWLVR